MKFRECFILVASGLPGASCERRSQSGEETASARAQFGGPENAFAPVRAIAKRPAPRAGACGAGERSWAAVQRACPPPVICDSDVQAASERAFYLVERFCGPLPRFSGRVLQLPVHASREQLSFNLVSRNSSKAGATREQLRMARARTVSAQIYSRLRGMPPVLSVQALPPARQGLLGHDLHESLTASGAAAGQPSAAFNRRGVGKAVPPGSGRTCR